MPLMLKSQSLKFSSMLVHRLWTRSQQARSQQARSESQTPVYKDVLDVWDSGNLRYERTLNGQDMSWEVVNRTLTDTGFMEVLKELPAYKVPFNIAWQETIPVNINNQGFSMAGWEVTQKIISVDKSNELVPGRRDENVHRGSGHRRGGRGRGR